MEVEEIRFALFTGKHLENAALKIPAASWNSGSRFIVFESENCCMHWALFSQVIFINGVTVSTSDFVMRASFVM